MSHTTAREASCTVLQGGRALPWALGAKPEDGGLQAVHSPAPGCVASNVDELGIHNQLQYDRQQLKPSRCPACTCFHPKQMVITGWDYRNTTL